VSFVPYVSRPMGFWIREIRVSNSSHSLFNVTEDNHQRSKKVIFEIKIMGTIQIELKNKNALSILKSLEKAKMIKMYSTERQTKDSPIHFKGAISTDRAIELANEIEKLRTEWNERTI